MLSVELLFYMHNFQRRFCWTLSSLCQQIGNIPELVINVASMKNNGNPSTEEVIDFYKARLNIKHIVFQDNERDVFAIASSVKDRQIATSKCDWIFNPDADHVYSPTFFEAMNKTLRKNNDCETCIGSRGRITTDILATDLAINETKGLYIDNAYDKAIKIDRYQFHKSQRIGSHIAFRREIFNSKCEGFYSVKRYDKHLFDRGMGSRSDRRFRGRMGGTVRCNWPPYIHLNHVRDKELGYHTEEQR